MLGMIALLFTALLALQDAPTADAKADSTLRVATFNIRLDTPRDGENRWALRKDLLVNTVKTMNPDAIGYQEVLAHQLDELTKAFPEYEFFGVGRDDGKRGGEFVPVAFKRDRFEQLAAGFFWLSETPEKPGSKSWDAAITRVTTWVRLKDRSTGRAILFVNTHFDHMGKQARVESAKLLRERLEALRDGVPVILVGDFNTGEGTAPYATLRGKESDANPLVDSFRAAHAQRGGEEGTFNGFKGARTGDRIDWIFHTPDVETLNCEIVRDAEGQRYPSDHFPVAAELAYEGRPERP
jgi:endonuclease/exonuclease/phosphatase family metal-dependent hydrolase